MIASIDPHLRSRLDDQTIDAIVDAVAGGVPCMICSGWLRGGHEDTATVVAVRAQDTGETLVRFAHPACSPSRLIEVQRLPAGVIDPLGSEELGPDLTWALSARGVLLPTIVLVWDAVSAAQLGVAGGVLLDSLCLEGMRGGRPIDRLGPPRVKALTARREDLLLIIATPHGEQALAIEELDGAMAALHVAARQGEIVLVVGERLGLGGADLDQTDRALIAGDAIAGIVAYRDEELAAVSLRAARRRRRRSRRRGVLSLMPSARRQRRLAAIGPGSELTSPARAPGIG
jgi:hypothetical protein